jgi:methionine-R-sulfoxide reductase
VENPLANVSIRFIPFFGISFLLIACGPKSISSNSTMPPSSTVTIRSEVSPGQLGEPQKVNKVIRTDDEWAKQLTPSQYHICRSKGTERPFCGNLLDNKKSGTYYCVCCDLPLFASNAKFNSGTGWPSFFQPIAKENITVYQDTSHGMIRDEITCTRCDSHLGHVFEDGPKPTGLRFCLNSESLTFRETTSK